MAKQYRTYVSLINRERIRALRAEMNVNERREKSCTQDDAITHLFKVLQEHRRLKQENLELKNRIEQKEENG